MSAFLPALLSGGASVLGGYLSRPRKQKETAGQKRSRQVADQLLASISGDGPFSDLFRMDDAAFQKSFIDPAKSIFENQLAPQIQQSFLAGGQQRGTGLQNQLTRAGVDLDQMLNQQYMNFLQSQQQNKLGALNTILGLTGGPSPGMGAGEAFSQSIGGFLSNPEFRSDVKDIFSQFNKPSEEEPSEEEPRGFSA